MSACFEECSSHQIVWNTSNCLESKERIWDFQRLVPVGSQKCSMKHSLYSCLFESSNSLAKAMMNTPVEGVSVLRDQKVLDLIKTRRTREDHANDQMPSCVSARLYSGRGRVLGFPMLMKRDEKGMVSVLRPTAKQLRYLANSIISSNSRKLQNLIG